MPRPFLTLHQQMWISHGGRSMFEHRYTERGANRHDIWIDEWAWSRLLPEMWAARRWDDWSRLTDVVRVAQQEVSERHRSNVLSDHNESAMFPVFGGLLHMLLYAGNGCHPADAVDQLLDDDPETPVYGGFTRSFRDLFAPVLQEMEPWLNQSNGFLSELTGSPKLDDETRWSGESTFTVSEPDDANSVLMAGGWDSLHLRSHATAPVEPQSEDWLPHIVDHQPGVKTMMVPDYSGWMEALRSMNIERPTLVKVGFGPASDWDDPNVLGFWLIQSSPSETHNHRNIARYTTDLELPAVMSLVVD
jgi:hypothetical protein